jgi:hypothetical protein
MNFVQGRDCMKPQRLVRLAAASVAILFFPYGAMASGIENQIRAGYENKVLTMRHYYEGPRLRFDSRGQVLGEVTFRLY